MRGVVASETRAAQTMPAEWPAGLCGHGVGRLARGRGSEPRAELATTMLAERHWNGRPQRVRAP